MTIALMYALVLGLGVWALVTDLQEPEPLSDHWRVVSVKGNSAYPLQSPILLEDAVIWRGFEDGLLRYQSLDGARAFVYDWLIGTPLQWQAGYIGEDIFLVWRDENQALWTTLLDPHGGQVTAPVSITGRGVLDFQVGAASVVWRNTAGIWLTQLDREGRPHVPVFIQQGVQDFAFTVDDAGIASLVWLSAGRLFFGSMDITVPTPVLDFSAPVPEFALSPNTHLREIILFSSSGRQVILWGYFDNRQPDATHYAGVIDLADPFTLSLSGNPLMRWLSVAGDRITAAAFINGIWHPVLISFHPSEPLAVRIVDGEPVTGGPVSAYKEHLAWVTLDERQLPRLYITTRDSSYGRLPVAWQNAARDGLSVVYLGLLWLVAPLGSFFALRNFQYRVVAGLSFYWLGKAALTFGMFSEIPVTLQDYDLSAAALTSGALFGSSLIATVMALLGWNKGSPGIRLTTYCLTDMVLTFAIFGVNVQSQRFF